MNKFLSDNIGIVVFVVFAVAAAGLVLGILNKRELKQLSAASVTTIPEASVAPAAE